ncbi:MAG: DUF3021 domain-containing protein [Lentihominibacter sp.]|jgi:hypothetical protein
MKEEIIKRCLIGAPIGLAISTAITIVISLIIGDGAFHSAVPAAISDFGTEINAVSIQAICSMLYGAAFAGASCIWNTDWSILKMTVTHFVICSTATFPVAYFMHWMHHSVGGIALYYGIFIAIYAIIWISQYFVVRSRIKELNHGLSKQ